jgi:hypothetical protein
VGSAAANQGSIRYASAAHQPGLSEVSIHPDGDHGKRFDFTGRLGKRGFVMSSGLGKTAYGGTYADGNGKTIVINPSSGRGDVAAEGEGMRIVAECKGGIVNTRHAGQFSRLRQGLCEVIGLSLATPLAGFVRFDSGLKCRSAWRAVRLRTTLSFGA